MSGRRRRFDRARRLAILTLAGFFWLSGSACDSLAQTRLAPTRPPASSGIWISHEEIRALPMSGPAWAALREAAGGPIQNPDLSNQNDMSNVRVFAKALYFVRTGEAAYREDVIDACRRIRGTEDGARTLALSRELMAYVIAADLVGLDADEKRDFSQWLENLSARRFQERTIRSTHEDRPNNWGTHAGATRLAIAAYLGDREEIERAAHVFSGWTGESSGWQGFKFGETWWQAEKARSFAVNPRRSTRAGHSIDGVLPDDQRRGGPFAWPPPKENYVWEALQGAIAQAVMLERQGYESWSWGNRALLRALEWLHREAHYPAEGDDTWIPPIVNRAYGTQFPAPIPSQPGKAIGFSGWTHAAEIATDTP